MPGDFCGGAPKSPSVSLPNLPTSLNCRLIGEPDREDETRTGERRAGSDSGRIGDNWRTGERMGERTAGCARGRTTGSRSFSRLLWSGCMLISTSILCSLLARGTDCRRSKVVGPCRARLACVGEAKDGCCIRVFSSAKLSVVCGKLSGRNVVLASVANVVVAPSMLAASGCGSLLPRPDSRGDVLRRLAGRGSSSIFLAIDPVSSQFKH